MSLEALSIVQARLTEADFGIRVRCMSLAGQELYHFQLGTSDTMEELQVKFLKEFAWGIVDIYATCDGKQEGLLQRQTLVRQYMEPVSLMISKGKLIPGLEKFPNVPRYLKSIKTSTWSDEQHPEVGLSEAGDLVYDLLESPSKACGFVQVLGRLTYDMASWQSPEQYSPLFPLTVLEHWLDLASLDRIPAEPTPLLLLKRSNTGDVMGFSIIAHSSSPAFQPRLQAVLRLWHMTPMIAWNDVLHVLISLDVNWDQTGQETFDRLTQGARDLLQERPSASDADVLRLVHVQVRLSCTGLAEVDGQLDSSCVDFMAKFLRYRLHTLTLDHTESSDLPKKLLDALGDAMDAFDEARDRGVLLLVQGLPVEQGQALKELCLNLMDTSRVPSRFVLCRRSQIPAE